MGDFYEIFFEDAEFSSKILNITLTYRGKLGTQNIPMAGIPYHAAGNYIDKLTVRGHKVALCDQVESSEEASGIVQRAVTRIVSPAIPYNIDKIRERDSHFIMSAYEMNGTYYLIQLDFTIGSFLGQKFETTEDFLDHIQKIGPKEFISHEGQWDSLGELTDLLKYEEILNISINKDYFNHRLTKIYIEQLIYNHERDLTLHYESTILSPIGALAYYIVTTQMIHETLHIRPFQFYNNSHELKISLKVLRGLEILPRHRDEYKNSLLGFIDKTQTALGQRKLKQVLLTPLRSQTVIVDRQNIISYFLDNDSMLFEVRKILAMTRDLERMMTKVSTQKIQSSDLLNISMTLLAYHRFISLLVNSPLKIFSDSKLLHLAKAIEITINSDPKASLEKGDLILPHVNKERDELADVSLLQNKKLLDLETQYRAFSQISKLKIKHNALAGYFVEVSKTSSHKLPSLFQKKQTLTHSERFTTPELLDFENKILLAKEKLARSEKKIFNDLIKTLKTLMSNIQQIASSIASIDLYQSLSTIAIQEQFTRPQIKEDRQIIDLTDVWHPLMKSFSKDQFVSHSLRLDETNFFSLITGPNMAGKTTVMREVAIVQILAQIGSFVPAKKATLGLCDYIFSRLGASDHILKGQSTFMVEMAETSEILRHATNRSLVILDEVGRGTSTYDGLSIAWALSEHLIKKTKAMTLFATHYHELIEVIEGLPCADNLTIKISRSKGKIHFLYGLIKGSSRESYGLHVAMLAGMPGSVLTRSKKILDTLENQHLSTNVKRMIAAIDMEKITSGEALEKLYEIKNLL